MKHRFLIHSLSHTIVVVDITSFGLPDGIYPKGGQEKMVPALRFQNWPDASQYFLDLGAGAEILEGVLPTLKRSGAAVLTII